LKKTNHRLFSLAAAEAEALEEEADMPLEELLKKYGYAGGGGGGGDSKDASDGEEGDKDEEDEEERKQQVRPL